MQDGRIWSHLVPGDYSEPQHPRTQLPQHSALAWAGCPTALGEWHCGTVLGAQGVGPGWGLDRLPSSAVQPDKPPPSHPDTLFGP